MDIELQNVLSRASGSEWRNDGSWKIVELIGRADGVILVLKSDTPAERPMGQYKFIIEHIRVHFSFPQAITAARLCKGLRPAIRAKVQELTADAIIENNVWLTAAMINGELLWRCSSGGA